MNTSPVTTTDEQFGTCPACDKPLIGQVTWEVTCQEATSLGERKADLKPIGVTLRHSCRPTTGTVPWPHSAGYRSPYPAKLDIRENTHE